MILNQILLIIFILTVLSVQFNITFTSYDDGKLKIEYHEANSTQTTILPKDNPYNALFLGYVKQYKLFN